MREFTKANLLKLINEQVNETDEKELDEYRTKGIRIKQHWNEGDQTLAYYFSLYGMEGLGAKNSPESKSLLGYSIQYIAHRIIGSTVGSLYKQSLNFNVLRGLPGLDRNVKDGDGVGNEMQEYVFEKYKGYDPKELKNILRNVCLEIIEYRIKHPEPSAINMELGNQIGDKKDEIEKGRKEGIKAQGHDPERNWLQTGGRPKYNPIVDDEDDEIDRSVETPSQSPHKKEILDYLNDIISKSESSGDSSMISTLKFIAELIDSDLTDKEQTISEIYNILKRKGRLSEKVKTIKNILTENKKMKRTIRLTESELNKVIKKIIKEQGYRGFDSFDDDAIDDEMDRDDAIDRWVSDDDEDTANQIHYNPRGSEMFKSAAEDLISQGYTQEDLFAMLGELLRQSKNNY